MRSLIGFSLGMLLAVSNILAADGKVLYETKCKMCHATDGTGNPAIAKMKKVELNQMNLTRDESKKRSDGELSGIVRSGRGQMKGVPKDSLDDEDLSAVISYVRTLQGKK